MLIRIKKRCFILKNVIGYWKYTADFKKTFIKPRISQSNI